ncbi:cellulose biosynthesis protein BcsR [Stenotrophomonas nitritireducens]|uniref:cellulose biosynthesis protein BcsR n=1 Tax=Stenotrophomonas nitritireducens TaxID=83617 RepID=UPI003D9962AA
MASEANAGLTSEADDIDVLREHLHMPGLSYVDFSAQRARAQALARWPLFAELAGEPRQ